MKKHLGIERYAYFQEKTPHKHEDGSEEFIEQLFVDEADQITLRPHGNIYNGYQSTESIKSPIYIPNNLLEEK